MQPRVLIVEDHADLAANIYDYLGAHGFQPDHAADAAGALRLLSAHSFEAIILDLGLPGRDGLELLRQLRESEVRTPIIIVSARDQLDTRILGLGLGADDYMIKPIDLPELQARLRSVLRRAAWSSQQPRATEPITTLSFGPISFNRQNHSVMRAGRTIYLTPTLGRLLASLLQAAPRVVTHGELIAQAWEGAGADVNTLHTQMSNLRLVLDKPFAEPIIHTERGLGYMLRLDRHDSAGLDGQSAGGEN
jgi:DNA-binding response OmpR family regulator